MFATRTIIVLLVAATVSASPAGSSHFRPIDDRTPVVRWRVPTTPLTGLAKLVASPFRRAPALENASTIARETGWTSLTFDINEPAQAIFLAVEGKAEFETADILFANGEYVSVDLHQSERGGGLFELHDLGTERQVERVRLTARAKSGQARVGLRLSR